MEPTRRGRRPAPVSDRRAAGSTRRRVRARAAPRRSDERGGAISLWVVLMVPVSAFAAVVAMAGPQRLAAESSVQDAADDLADFAVVWRDGHKTPTGELPAFPPECAARSEQQAADLDALSDSIAALVALAAQDPTDSGIATELARLDGLLDAQHTRFGMQLPLFPATDPSALERRFDELVSRLDEWEGVCDALFEALVRDLGYLGVDMGSLRGFYSDSLTESAMMMGTCFDPAHTTEAACNGAGEQWFDGLCRTSEQTVVWDAVHVALAADWQHAGWAAAQVWPDGLPMAAESVGRVSQRDDSFSDRDCGQELVLLDEQGRPVWAGTDQTPKSRKLVQSVGRTPLSG